MRYTLAEMNPMPMVEPIKMQIEITISYHATVLKQILVNIAMGEVNGIYEQMTIAILSTEPLFMGIETTMSAIINMN